MLNFPHNFVILSLLKKSIYNNEKQKNQKKLNFLEKFGENSRFEKAKSRKFSKNSGFVMTKSDKATKNSRLITTKSHEIQ